MFRFLSYFLLFFTITPSLYAEFSSCTTHQCIAVIDAGSTGSRLHIFTYDLDETNSPTQINEIWSKKITPGLATIGATQNQVDTYLTHLFSEAPLNIPVYFYATAGMRLIPQTVQKIYYQKVQNWFNKQSKWHLVEAKTITGNEEALYDWLAVNYHLGTLKSSTSESIGVMDIGGASVQIVFPMPSKSTYQKKTLNQHMEFDLYGQHFKLFVHSFLGLGQNEMSHQFLNVPSCFSEGFILPDGALGQGDAQICKEKVLSLINTHQVSNKVQPALTATHINSWYVIGGLPYLVESPPFQFEGNQITNQDLLQQANHLICHSQWESLSSQFSNEYLELYCLLPSFYYALMVDGYGLDANQPINYVPSEQNQDWTIGVVLHHF